MSAPLDVLSVMDSAGIALRREWSTKADQLVEARAAVAELVEAVRERRRISAAGKQSTGPFADSDARIDAALAKFGGAA